MAGVAGAVAETQLVHSINLYRGEVRSCAGRRSSHCRPGHCATLMNPQYRELGAAYAVDPQSDAGIYWTALFGSP